MHFNSSSWCGRIYSNKMLSLSQYHAKAATKINFSKKEKKINFFFFSSAVEQATGALMVTEAVSKLRSVNPEYFPGKLKHSSHPSRAG